MIKTMSAGILFGACDIFFYLDGSEHLRMHGYIIHSTLPLFFKMFFSLDLLLSEKWSWFPTSSQASHLLLKPGDCSVLAIWSSKTQSMNNYLFLLFCGSVTRDNSSRDFHPLRYSFADVVQADDDVRKCQRCRFFMLFESTWHRGRVQQEDLAVFDSALTQHWMTVT